MYSLCSRSVPIQLPHTLTCVFATLFTRWFDSRLSIIVSFPTSSRATSIVAMFSMTVLTTIKVKADHLRSPVTIDVRMVEGAPYFKCAKSGWLARLLCNDGSTVEKALTGSLLLQSIQSLRDDLCRTKIATVKYKRPSKRSKALRFAVHGSIGDILTPTIAGFEGRHLSVIFDHPKSAPWLRADPDVFEYMYNVINAERENCKPNEPVKMCRVKTFNQELDLPTGVIEIKTGKKKGWVRVQKKVTDELTPEKTAKRKYRYLQIDYTNPENTVSRAREWQHSIESDESEGDQSSSDDAGTGDDVAEDAAF